MILMEQDNENEKEESPNARVSVTSGAFPLNLFKEWDKDCQSNFGNCRWMKMWHDHCAAQDMDVFRVMFEEIETLKKRMSLLEKKPEEDEPVKTLTGTVEERR